MSRGNTIEGKCKVFPRESIFFTCNWYYLGKIYAGKFVWLSDWEQSLPRARPLVRLWGLPQITQHGFYWLWELNFNSVSKIITFIDSCSFSFRTWKSDLTAHRLEMDGLSFRIRVYKLTIMIEAKRRRKIVNCSWSKTEGGMAGERWEWGCFH